MINVTLQHSSTNTQLFAQDVGVNFKNNHLYSPNMVDN